MFCVESKSIQNVHVKCFLTSSVQAKYPKKGKSGLLVADSILIIIRWLFFFFLQKQNHFPPTFVSSW